MTTQPKKLGSSDQISETAYNCSYCGKSFSRSQTKCMPFCSTRCQQLDLNNWLSESYGLPVEGEEDREFGSVEQEEDEA